MSFDSGITESGLCNEMVFNVTSVCKLQKMPMSRLRMKGQDNGVSKIHPYMVKMVSSSYIHGVKEVYSSKTIQEKAFWVLVCLLCCCAATYEIVQIVVTYRDRSVATKIHINSVNTIKYPTLLVCPTKWVSNRKIKTLGVDEEVVKYMWSIFETVVPAKPMVPFRPDLPDKIAEALKKTKSKTLAELALNLSINITRDNVKCNPLCCNMETMKKVVTLHGVCFVLELCNSLFQSREKSPHLLVSINASDALQNFDLINGGVLALYENMSQVGVAVQDHIILFADTMTMIKLSLSQVKRMSTYQSPCRTTKNLKGQDTMATCEFDCIDSTDNRLCCNHTYTTATCEFDCIDSTENRLCHNCSKYSIFREVKSLDGGNYTLKQCSSNDGGIRCSKDVERKLLECKSRCLPPCEQTIYNVQSVTAVNLPKTHNCGYDETVDCLQAVLYFPMFTKCDYEDVPTLSLDTFIANIGGQTGLWLGASVVSVCQVISFFCCPCLHWADLRSTYTSFKNHKHLDDDEHQRRRHLRRHSEIPTRK